MRFQLLRLAELEIDDAASFKHVALYAELASALEKDGFTFRVPAVPPSAPLPSWDRILFLNLSFWSAHEPSDVLVEAAIPADVVAHAAWHHLARKQLGELGSTADGLFFGEAVASAFDLYLVGRLLGHAPDSQFLQTQVPAMSDAAQSAGLDEEAFEALLAGVAADPDQAFEDLRALLFDAGTTLLRARSVDEAAALLERFDSHRFACLLHHYELSNWLLYAKAYASSQEPCPGVRELDRRLRSEPGALERLADLWLRQPA